MGREPRAAQFVSLSLGGRRCSVWREAYRSARASKGTLRSPVGAALCSAHHPRPPESNCDYSVESFKQMLQPGLTHIPVRRFMDGPPHQCFSRSSKFRKCLRHGRMGEDCWAGDSPSVNRPNILGASQLAQLPLYQQEGSLFPWCAPWAPPSSPTCSWFFLEDTGTCTAIVRHLGGQLMAGEQASPSELRVKPSITFTALGSELADVWQPRTWCFLTSQHSPLLSAYRACRL